MELKQGNVRENGLWLQKEEPHIVEHILVSLVVVSLGVMALGIIFIK